MGKTLTITLISLMLSALLGCGGDEGSDTSSATADRPVTTTAEPTGGTHPRTVLAGIPPERIDRIVELFNQGVARMEQYQPVQATAAFDEVVRLAPGWTTGRLNLGIALLNTQSNEGYARAERELTRVIAEAPDNPHAHYALGMLQRHLTRFDAARDHFRRVLEIDPGDADAHYQLGILITDEDPDAARAHLEAALRAMPHHESAAYRLQALLRRAGETEQAAALLARFQTLKSSGSGAASGMKYGKMGRYAQVIRAFAAEPVVAEASDHLPVPTNVAAATGLVHAAAGAAGWPATGIGTGPPQATHFGPGVAVVDVDGDDDLDIYMTGVGPDRRGVLYLRGDHHLAAAPRAGIDGGDAIGAFFGDYDGDGDPDLYLTCVGPNRLYRNDSGARFTDVTQATGTGGGSLVSVGAAWADADHDGDLDLYVANFSPAATATPDRRGAPNTLWRNNGDGTFADVAPAAGIDGGEAATLGVSLFDADDDLDLDIYLINHHAPNRLFLNDRIGRYTEATTGFAELADDGPGLGAVLGDVDLNGLEDLLLLRGQEPPRLFRQEARGRFVEDQNFAATAREIGAATGSLFGDLDLDGDLDLVLLCAGEPAGTRFQHLMLLNTGDGRFAAPLPFGNEHDLPDARGAVIVDLDRDGALELLITRAAGIPELWQIPAPRDHHWLEIIPAPEPAAAETGRQLWIEPTAIGLRLEAMTGRNLQMGRVSSAAGYLGGTPPLVHFGLGRHGKVDYVRLAWPDAVLQSELEVAADRTWRIPKVMRKPSSCPILFAWDGERFAFITDFLGVGGVGFFITPDEYAPPDPTEDIRIPPAALAPHQNRYLLRVAEPLEEVTYFDELHLLAYDHPGEWELHPDERFTGTPPFPTGHPIAVAEKIFPAGARNHRGEDVRQRILSIDRRYAEPPVNERFVGYADDHWLEIDFGHQLRELAPDARLVLFLHGWVEYTYSHVNYAAHQAGITMRAPSIEVPDQETGWRVVMPEMGFPAGLPRMMTVDVSALPIRDQGRLRIRTNMEVFWDQVFLGVDLLAPATPESGMPVAGIHTHTLRPTVADLRLLGYPREYSPDGADPTLYDYHRLDQGVSFKNLAGNFTRFGDVRALLEQVDDQFVIMARGEEIALEFDAGDLPPIPTGWTRTFVLHADGYCKDMDLYTAFPSTVGPLPYHGMENYPPRVETTAAAAGNDLSALNSRHVAGN